MSAFLKRILLNDLLNSLHKQHYLKYSSVQTIIYKQRSLFQDEKNALESRTGKSHAINKLMEVLGIKRSAALDLVIKNKKLARVPIKIFSKNYATCKDFDITIATCIKHTDLLIENDLDYKFRLLVQIPYEINACAGLALIKKEQLEKYLDRELQGNQLTLRIDTMSKNLLVKPEIIFDAFPKRPFLRTISLQKFNQLVNLLLDNGVRTDEIIKDWWVLQYSPSTIKERINYAKTNNVEKVKTWMVRAPPCIIENYLKRRYDDKAILGNSTLIEYLSERLDCTKDVASLLVAKLPALEHKNIKKMQEIIDFLYQVGYKPYHICRVPKILLHSVDTTKKRIWELQKQGLHIDSLHILIKSQKQYIAFYESLVKSNKSKIKMPNE